MKYGPKLNSRKARKQRYCANYQTPERTETCIIKPGDIYLDRGTNWYPLCRKCNQKQISENERKSK